MENCGRNICIDGKPIYTKSWCINGIRCIEDLLSVNLKFLALSEVKEKYNFEFPFNTYYGLSRALPTEWKSALRVTAGENGESQKCETSLKLFSTNEAYSTTLDKSFSAPTAEGRILNHGLTKEEISNIYTLPFKILKKPKLTMFEVKSIHNILPTQSSLFYARITNNVCPLCNLESQPLKHMLIINSVSPSFWTCFCNRWQERLNQKLILSESTILYGWHKEKNNWEVLNYCLIVPKYNVFAASVRNGVLDFDSFLLRLNNKIDILRTIAFRSNRLPQFKKTCAKLL